MDRNRRMPAIDKIEPNSGSGVNLLTQRERDCLALVGAFKSSKQIAAELDLSFYTVNQHIASAMRRLQVADRRQAAQIYAEFQLRSDAGNIKEDQSFARYIPNDRDVANNSLGIAIDPQETPSTGVNFGANNGTTPGSDRGCTSSEVLRQPDRGFSGGLASSGVDI